MKGLLTLLAGLVAFTTTQADPQIYYYHLDQLGTPQALTDANQAVVWRADYEPFGLATVTLQNGINNPIRFPGQYYDAETGLHYNYFRDYNPSTGRYIESDPIGLNGGLNTYAYVENNPLIFIDPDGYASTKIGGDRVTVHKNDADPWPSDPHGHIYDKNQVVDKEGNIFDKSTGKKIGQLSKKQKDLWKKFLKKIGRGVKCIAPLFFVYDVINSGFDEAVNNMLWPASELWRCDDDQCQNK